MKGNCAAGYNWGTLDVNSEELVLSNDGLLVFKTKSSDIMKTTVSNKTEVSIEFDDSKEGDALQEIKFATPQTEDRTERDNVQELYERIKEHTTANTLGKEVCLIEKVHFISPKGHYDVKFYEDSVRLLNKSYDYKINYADISRYYTLYRNEETSFFMIKLSNPLKKGKSTYEHVVMELSSKEEVVCLSCRPKQLSLCRRCNST